MLEHIPSLMNGIKMIHVVSQYYNTSERMSSLLLKVTNQMISTCRSYLLQGVRRVWEHSSENYIFGKFDSFCRRLEKMADMASTLESLAALQSMKVEDMEKICVRYQTIVSTTESKTCDVLDQRKLEAY
ncbi:unnamed protein product [Oreochromis niloticus]|nr:unnamed protein product [Mustela putorius furo]